MSDALSACLVAEDVRESDGERAWLEVASAWHGLTVTANNAAALEFRRTLYIDSATQTSGLDPAPAYPQPQHHRRGTR